MSKRNRYRQREELPPNRWVWRDGASYAPLVEEPEETKIEYLTDEDWDLRPWWCRFGDEDVE